MERRTRAPDLTIELRIQAILQIKLDGAEAWDICQFVSAKEQADEAPWKMGQSKKPLSERQIRRYMAEADKRIGEAFVTSNAEGIAHHVLKRRNLYARAVNAGDLRTALAILADLATLEGLYPAKGVKLSGQVSTNHDDLAEMSAAELKAEIERLDRLMPDAKLDAKIEWLEKLRCHRKASA